MSFFPYIFIIIFATQSFIEAEKIDFRLARDYFRERGIRQICAFGCWNFSEKVEFFYNAASSLDTKLSYAPISIDLSIKDFLKVDYHKLGILYDLNCPESEVILDQLRNTIRNWSPFNESYYWLMTTRNHLPIALLQNLPLSIDAEVTVAVTVFENNRRYELYDVYKPSYRHSDRLNVTKLGHWDEGLDELELLRQYKYKRRGDLQGMRMNFSIVVDFPPKGVDLNTYLTNPINRHLDTMHRYNYALTLQLRDYYNFTMNLMRGETWGYLINGTFNGIVGDMLKGIVDVGATPFQYKAERMDVMDYTVQAYMAKAAIIFRHPKRQELNNRFLEPFSHRVWWLTVIVGLLNWVLLYLTLSFEKKYKVREQPSTLFDQMISETFLTTSAALCQQGLSDTPSMYSGRIVYMSLFVWALLLYQFYSASIVGSLLSEKPRFIKNLQDLTYSNLEVGIENMPYNHDFFRTTTDKTVIELYERKIALNKKRKKYPFFTAEEGLRKVKKGDFAFQVDVATAYKIITDTFNEDEICDLQEIELFGPKHTATCTAKHSPFKKMVTYGLRQIVEHGMTRRLDTVWKPRKPVCPESHNSIPTPVSLSDFTPVLVMISAAFFLSIFVMLVENLAKIFIYRNYNLPIRFLRSGMINNGKVSSSSSSSLSSPENKEAEQSDQAA